MGREADVLFQFHKLCNAIKNGSLTPAFPGPSLAMFNMQRQGALLGLGAKGDIQITEKTPVRIGELRHYADSIGEHPSFLFPDG